MTTTVSVFTAPRFSDDEVAREANAKHRGDTEKVATGPIASTDWEGVNIASRYSKAHEIEIMALMVSMVPAWMRKGVLSVFCDSKATAVYSVKLATGFPAEAADAVARQMEAACIAVQGGHNGIFLNGHDGEEISVHPNWTEAWLRADGLGMRCWLGGEPGDPNWLGDGPDPKGAA